MGQSNGRRASGPRCIALVGPFASGKTTLLEAILARTGRIPRQGSVSGGSSVGDASPEAREHVMSVEINVADCDFLGETFTFLDCPGSVEFLAEQAAVLPVVDLAVVVCEADEKKLPALQVILKELEAAGIPHVLFLNKIDKASAGVRDTLKMMQTASSRPLVLRQIPIWSNGVATGFIDLALERAFVYREHAPSEIIDMSDDDRARETEARFQMLESLADHDDVLMEQLLEDIQPERDRIFEDLVREMREGVICPVFIGAAEHGNGVFRLLKAIRHEAPGITDTAERLGASGSGAVVQIVKTVHTSHAGKLSLARVLCGTVHDGDTLIRSDGSEDRISGLYRVFGAHVTKRDPAGAGETVGLGKLEHAVTGDTLGATRPEKPFVNIVRQQPVMSLAVAPAERKDEVKLSAALAKLVEEDPSLVVTHVQETGETLIAGQGEMHLRVAVERLTGKYGLSINTHAPQVPYMETIRGSTTKRGRHKKQTGGHGQFGDVVLEIRAMPRGEGFTFSERITGGVVPKQYIPSVEAGVRDYLSCGPLGFPVVDVAVTLIDGSYHSVDSSDQAFRTAAQIAMREGMAECQPVLLEPVMRVDIHCPSDATAKVNAIVSARRGQLLGFDARVGWPGWDTVSALIPQAEIGDLIVEVRSATAGVGTFDSRFDHLAELTGKLAEQVLERHSKAA